MDPDRSATHVLSFLPSERAGPDKFQRKNVAYKKDSNPKLHLLSRRRRRRRRNRLSDSERTNQPLRRPSIPDPSRSVGMAPAVDIAEVPFDAKKHMNVRYGSLVEDKPQDLGYLTYPMPPEGAFDPATDSKILNNIKGEMIGPKAKGNQVRVGSAKTLRKVRDKAVRRVVVAYLSQ